MTVPQGLSTLSNPFNYESNLVSQVLTNVPEGTQLYKFNAAAQRWQVNQFQFGGWAQGEQTLTPGEGAFIRNPSNPFSITFTGTPAPTNFVVSVPPGYNLLSVPAGAMIELNPKSEDQVLIWYRTQTNYTNFFFVTKGLWASTREFVSDPPYRTGESFFYYRTPAPGEAVPQILPSVYLNNYAPASGVNAPISSTYGCFGSNYLAQLYAPGFGPVGEPIPLLASAGAAYIDPKFAAVRSVSNWGIAIQLRVWDSRRGNTFEEAWQLAGIPLFGQASKVFVLRPQSNLLPPLNLVGLEPFGFGPLATFWVFFPYPSNAEVVEGQSAAFEIGKVGGQTGLPDLFTYQWQRETLPDTWTDIAGETSKLLVIPSVQKADAGRYRVVSRFDCASDVSMPSVLTVFEQPRLDAALMSEGRQNLLLSGIGSVQIEVSYDLSHWTNFATAANGSGRWEVVVTNVSEFGQRFFRARPAP